MSRGDLPRPPPPPAAACRSRRQPPSSPPAPAVATAGACRPCRQRRGGCPRLRWPPPRRGRCCPVAAATPSRPHPPIAAAAAGPPPPRHPPPSTVPPPTTAAVTRPQLPPASPRRQPPARPPRRRRPAPSPLPPPRDRAPGPSTKPPHPGQVWWWRHSPRCGQRLLAAAAVTAAAAATAKAKGPLPRRDASGGGAATVRAAKARRPSVSHWHDSRRGLVAGKWVVAYGEGELRVGGGRGEGVQGTGRWPPVAAWSADYNPMTSRLLSFFVALCDGARVARQGAAAGLGMRPRGMAPHPAPQPALPPPRQLYIPSFLPPSALPSRPGRRQLPSGRSPRRRRTPLPSLAPSPKYPPRRPPPPPHPPRPLPQTPPPAARRHLLPHPTPNATAATLWRQEGHYPARAAAAALRRLCRRRWPPSARRHRARITATRRSAGRPR